MTAPEEEEQVQSLLPERLQREPQALGLFLTPISRSLVITVVAVAIYVTDLAW